MAHSCTEPVPPRFATENEYDYLFDVAPDGDLIVATANDKPPQLVFAEDWLAGVRKRLLAARK